MKHVLFYIAAAVVLVAAAVYVWGKFRVKGADAPEYTDGKARGAGVGFMDPSVANSGVTPTNSGVSGLTAKPSFRTNPWYGGKVAVTATAPTSNPVRVQTKTIW